MLRDDGCEPDPLHVATVNFDPQMCQLLIQGRADVNHTDADGNTPLHVLMSVFDKGGRRATQIGQILLRHGADVNAVSDSGSTSVRSVCYIVRPGLESCHLAIIR